MTKTIASATDANKKYFLTIDEQAGKATACQCPDCKFWNSMSGILIIKWAAKRAIGYKNVFAPCQKMGSFRSAGHSWLPTDSPTELAKFRPFNSKIYNRTENQVAELRSVRKRAFPHVLSSAGAEKEMGWRGKAT